MMTVFTMSTHRSSQHFLTTGVRTISSVGVARVQFSTPYARGCTPCGASLSSSIAMGGACCTIDILIGSVADIGGGVSNLVVHIACRTSHGVVHLVSIISSIGESSVAIIHCGIVCVIGNVLSRVQDGCVAVGMAALELAFPLTLVVVVTNELHAIGPDWLRQVGHIPHAKAIEQADQVGE